MLCYFNHRTTAEIFFRSSGFWAVLISKLCTALRPAAIVRRGAGIHSNYVSVTVSYHPGCGCVRLWLTLLQCYELCVAKYDFVGLASDYPGSKVRLPGGLVEKFRFENHYQLALTRAPVSWRLDQVTHELLVHYVCRCKWIIIIIPCVPKNHKLQLVRLWLLWSFGLNIHALKSTSWKLSPSKVTLCSTHDASFLRGNVNSICMSLDSLWTTSCVGR